jgi:hypothetical protein
MLVNTPGTLSTPIGMAYFSARVLYRDERMKQAQSDARKYHGLSRSSVSEPIDLLTRRRVAKSYDHATQGRAYTSSWSPGYLFMGILGIFWFIITLPFRLIFGAIAWLGRWTAVMLGFSFMVIGMALWAGPLFFLGIPLFLLGLVLMLRCLD